MKYTALAVLAMFGLSACTTVPSAVHDAAHVSSTIVNGGVRVGASVLDGAANVVVNTGRDVSAVVNGAASMFVPTFYSFP